MSQIRIAVIGAGQLDADHQNALRTLSRQQTLTAYSLDLIDEVAGRGALQNAKAANALDAVMIAAPREQMLRWLQIALESGLHAYSVHPIPASIEDMVEIRRAEQAAPDQILQFGFTARQHESIQTALAKSRTGEYGNLLTLRAVCGLSGPGEDSLLAGPAAQMVDLMHIFAGPFQDISGFGDLGQTGSEQNIQAVLRTHSGTLASLHVSATQWRETFRLELGYERGYLWLEGLTSKTHNFGQEVLVYARTGQSGAQHETVERFQESYGPQSALEQFIARLHDPSQPATGTSQQAFDTLNTLQRIHAADPITSFSEERQAS
ncbi:MAG: hypothetical protein AAGB16_01765 [Pseudomonadota bacterium]